MDAVSIRVPEEAFKALQHDHPCWQGLEADCFESIVGVLCAVSMTPGEAQDIRDAMLSSARRLRGIPYPVRREAGQDQLEALMVGVQRIETALARTRSMD